MENKFYRLRRHPFEAFKNHYRFQIDGYDIDMDSDEMTLREALATLAELFDSLPSFEKESEVLMNYVNSCMADGQLKPNSVILSMMKNVLKEVSEHLSNTANVVNDDISDDLDYFLKLCIEKYEKRFQNGESSKFKQLNPNIVRKSDSEDGEQSQANVIKHDFTKGLMNESMGFNPDIPQELVDYIYKQYVKTTFTHRGEQWETSFDVRTGNVVGLPDFLTFVVEKGNTDDYYDAAVYADGTIHLNVDALSSKSPEEAKSSIMHELTHVLQHEKVEKGERGEGEFGYNKAVNAGYMDVEDKRASLWMMENLQETEIEARLTQIYHYVKDSMKGIPLRTGNANEAVKETLEAMEDVTKLNDLQTAIEKVESLLATDYKYYIQQFVEDAYAALYGKRLEKKLPLQECKRLAERLLDIYRMRYDRYRRKAWNAVWQGMMDAER